MPIPPKRESFPRATAKERVYRTLCQWIIDGTLEPGERLSDQELAQYFSVSRTPVREALQLLGEQKLIRVVPSSGTYVAPINSEDMRAVYQLIIGFQKLALELTPQPIAAADLEKMAALNESLLRLVQAGAASQAAEADFRLHQYLCALAGNPYLDRFFGELLLQARRNENRFFKEDARFYDSYRSHQKILELLGAGDVPGAMGELEDNWHFSMEGIL